MTREELVEKVARATYVQEHGVDDEFSFYSPPYMANASLAIDIVLEEAAKVCESGKPFSFRHDGRRPLTADECAAAIRALKGK